MYEKNNYYRKRCRKYLDAIILSAKKKQISHKILRFNSLYLIATNKNQLKFLIDF